MSLKLESSAFGQNEEIPQRYTCDGENISPPLAWSGVPGGTEELLLVCDDPDAPAGTFHHWAVYNIPVEQTGLEEGFGPENLAGGLHMAVNDFGKTLYGGPCPPKGHGEHHYHFRLSALSKRIAPPGPVANCSGVIRLARPHILESAELVGVYRRR